MFSAVITPKAQGTPVSSWTRWVPVATSSADVVVVAGLAANHDTETGDAGEAP